MNHFIQYFIYYLYNLFYYFKSIFKKTLPLPTPVVDKTKKYLLDKTEYFNAHKINSLYSQQIEPFFYDKSKYTEILKDSQNIYETLWKTRILFENTPRGNVIMMYDIYKMGFCYYSDQQVINYDILNAIAMKYVISFRCLDFFIDEKYYISSFLKLYETVDTKETHTQKRIHQQNNTIRQTYSHQPLQVAKQTQKPTATTSTTAAPEPITIKNRFLYQGKIANFSFIQKIPKKRAVIKHNTFNALFEKNPQMSYSDFKKSLMANKSNS